MATEDSLVIRALWWSHLVVVILLYVLFFIPESIVPQIASIHLYYMLWIALAQAFWGIIMTKFRGAFALVCPMTTLMQYLRGYPPSDSRNHSHSFVVEFMKHLGAEWNFKLINNIMIVTIIAVVIRYVL